MNTNRRQFLGSATGLLGLAALHKPASLFAEIHTFGAEQFACNVYTWYVFFQREGRDWYGDLDTGLGEFVKSGIKGYEPSINSVEQLNALVPLLEKHGLWMRSIYIGTLLHDRDQAEESIEKALAIAERARQAGVEIIVTNPSPLRSGGSNDKTDAQLELQAEQLDRLGAELRRLGLVLAYHNHDPEMRRSAREFHHMMLATDPDNVKLCLDAHWVFRGAGDSQVALFDIIKLYGSRIVELHLRQSQNGIWTEALGEGDIDYARLTSTLAEMNLNPLLVLEQAIEEGSPNTMNSVEAHRKSLEYATSVFADLLE